MTASMAKSGEAGDSPAPKDVPLPAGHAAGHHGSQGYTGDHPKFQSAGDYLEVPSGAYMEFPYPEIHYSKYGGLGPVIAAGVYLRTPPVSLDLSAISGRFSILHSVALAGDTTLEAFRPPVTRSEPVIVQSPREHARIIALKNYIKRANLLRLVKRERLVEKREDRAERHDQRVEKREIRADEKESMNHTMALALEQQRKKIEEDKQEASIALQKERMKFEEERKTALLALEEERRKLDEYKLQVSQQAGAQVKGDASIDKKDKGQVSLVVSTVETAETRLGLLEKLIDN